MLPGMARRLSPPALGHPMRCAGHVKIAADVAKRVAELEAALVDIRDRATRGTRDAAFYMRCSGGGGKMGARNV